MTQAATALNKKRVASRILKAVERKSLRTTIKRGTTRKLRRQRGRKAILSEMVEGTVNV